jgi:cell fate regulator YaaT (PSP1 superfamily)
MGHVGRFAAVDATRFPRGSRVVVRTERGLEIGEVLAPPADDSPDAADDGVVLRGMTIEDELLAARLERNRRAALDACQSRLDELGLAVPLVDVEHLFDGQSLVFYFLGSADPRLETITAELAELYEAKVQFRAFAETVNTGCGPGCGTEAATGAGCSSCSTGCAVAGACATKSVRMSADRHC